MNKNISKLFLVLTVTSVVLVLFAASVPAITSSDCEDLIGCKKKICEIEKQIEISQKTGNKQKTDGLRKALKNVKENCTDKGLKDNLIEKIRVVKEEIVEYESDLKEAKEYGKTDKVLKYQNKINEEKSKIKSLEDELSKLD